MIKSFDEVFEDVTKLGVKIKTDEYHPIGKYQIIDQGQEAVAGYSDLEDGVFENVPAIVFGDHTRIVKYVDQPFFLGADGVKVLRSRFKDANYRYLYYALKSVKIPNTGYNRHFKWLKEAKIYYPNSEEQSKIVSILDGISSVIEHRQQELQKLDELVKARFVEMFGDMILNPNSWEKVDLGTVCDVRDGTHDSPKYFAEGIPLVTSRNLSSGRIDFTDCNLICEADYNKINERSKVDLGDILMPMIGTVGNPIIVDIDAEFAIKNVALIKFSENSKVVNVFVKALLESDYFDRAVLDKVRGGTQKFISLGDIRRLKVCLPPLEVQKQFAAFVTQADKSKAAVQKALDETQLLFDSLMQQYLA